LRATFFLQGRWVTAYPETARQIVERGHLIGNHSNSHAPMNQLTDEGLRADVSEAEENIRRITGADPRPWFRCPFGAGADDPRVLGVLESLGYQDVYWDVDPEDWQDTQTPQGVESAVMAGIEAAGEAAVVLLHTWPAPTPQSLPALIARVRGMGATLTTVDRMPLPAVARTH
jgi:peptidoglycan/xylan/chitin deacetylase (PgdA/CDA1 family)